MPKVIPTKEELSSHLSTRPIDKAFVIITLHCLWRVSSIFILPTRTGWVMSLHGSQVSASFVLLLSGLSKSATNAESAKKKNAKNRQNASLHLLLRRLQQKLPLLC